MKKNELCLLTSEEKYTNRLKYENVYYNYKYTQRDILLDVIVTLMAENEVLKREVFKNK